MCSTVTGFAPGTTVGTLVCTCATDGTITITIEHAMNSFATLIRTSFRIFALLVTSLWHRLPKAGIRFLLTQVWTRMQGSLSADQHQSCKFPGDRPHGSFRNPRIYIVRGGINKLYKSLYSAGALGYYPE